MSNRQEMIQALIDSDIASLKQMALGNDPGFDGWIGDMLRDGFNAMSIRDLELMIDNYGISL